MKGTPRTSRRMATNQQFLAPPFLFCLSLLFASLTPKHIINGSPHVALSIQWWAPKNKRNHLNKIVYNRLGSTVKWGLIKFRQFENRPRLIFLISEQSIDLVLLTWHNRPFLPQITMNASMFFFLYWVDGIFLFCCHPRKDWITPNPLGNARARTRTKEDTLRTPHGIIITD